MKTLDEVIKAFEICIGYYCSNAEHDVCPYLGESDMGCMKEPEKDALHYLKEYKKVTDVMHEHGFGSVWGITLPDPDKVEGKPDIDGCANPPLTWDELKGMEGKPVWIEYNLHLSDKDARSRMWIIIQQIFPWKKDNELIYYSGFVFGKDEIGKAWNAYRKERENDTPRSN